MRLKFLVCAALVYLSLPVQGQSVSLQNWSSMEMRTFCGIAQIDDSQLSDMQRDQENICISYVVGVLDGFRIAKSPIRICVPSGVTWRELALVVSKYLDEHPETLQQSPSYNVVNAVRAAFPCSVKAPASPATHN